MTGINHIEVDSLVRVPDTNVPQHEVPGRVMKIKDGEALVRYPRSLLWIGIRSLEAVA